MPTSPWSSPSEAYGLGGQQGRDRVSGSGPETVGEEEERWEVEGSRDAEV